MSVLTQFYGGGGGGNTTGLSGSSPTVVLSNHPNPLAPSEVGVWLNSTNFSAARTQTVPIPFLSLTIRNHGYRDLEFFTPVTVGAEGGYGGIYMGNFTTIKNCAYWRKALGEDDPTVLEDPLLIFEGSNLTTIDGLIIGVDTFADCKYTIQAPNCTSLTTVDNIWFGGSDITYFEIDFSGCSLDEASVDRILVAALDSFNQLGYQPGVGNIIDLSGGSNAPPGAAGTAAIATIQGFPNTATITTN